MSVGSSGPGGVGSNTSGFGLTASSASNVKMGYKRFEPFVFPFPRWLTDVDRADFLNKAWLGEANYLTDEANIGANIEASSTTTVVSGTAAAGDTSASGSNAAESSSQAAANQAKDTSINPPQNANLHLHPNFMRDTIGSNKLLVDCFSTNLENVCLAPHHFYRWIVGRRDG